MSKWTMLMIAGMLVLSRAAAGKTAQPTAAPAAVQPDAGCGGDDCANNRANAQPTAQPTAAAHPLPHLPVPTAQSAGRRWADSPPAVISRQGSIRMEHSRRPGPDERHLQQGVDVAGIWAGADNAGWR